MEFSKQLAQEISEKFSLAPGTIRTWKHRGTIPDEYFEEQERVTLKEVISDTELNQRIEKFGKEMERLINTRKFKAGQDHNYYIKCLISLCVELS